MLKSYAFSFVQGGIYKWNGVFMGHRHKIIWKWCEVSAEKRSIVVGRPLLCCVCATECPSGVFARALLYCTSHWYSCLELNIRDSLVFDKAGTEVYYRLSSPPLSFHPRCSPLFTSPSTHLCSIPPCIYWIKDRFSNEVCLFIPPSPHTYLPFRAPLFSPLHFSPLLLLSSPQRWKRWLKWM